jgi:hypothetical protein
LKTEISRITNLFLSIFIYKKRSERDRRVKEERREPVEIEIKIRPYQLQTTITFDRKLRFRHSVRLRKTNDEIYRLTVYAVITIFEANKSHLEAQKPI